MFYPENPSSLSAALLLVVNKSVGVFPDLDRNIFTQQRTLNPKELNTKCRPWILPGLMAHLQSLRQLSKAKSVFFSAVSPSLMSTGVLL